MFFNLKFVNKIVDVYDEVFFDLKKENQQLKKERNTMACLVNDLQETLEEIREFVVYEKEYAHLNRNTPNKYYEYIDNQMDKLLQIIDKLKKED
ncbi:MAG: hypothetical protein E7167_04040 [Firmicutes bacterium]|nr:hypothetical protein [Bacillota bacterium]